MSQLLEHTERILSHLEQNENVDVIYLDFSKAFDRVDHHILLHKLKRNGVAGKLLKWIESFIMGRTQRVMVNSHLSEVCEILSGVPQGSVLGPLLFLIMIADMDDKLKYTVLSSFADGTRVINGIKSLLNIFELQYDLNMIYNWTKQNNMLLNGKKFEHVSYMEKILN